MRADAYRRARVSWAPWAALVCAAFAGVAWCGELSVRCVDSASGVGVADVRVGAIIDSDLVGSVTDGEGRVSLTFPGERIERGLSISVSAEGFVPIVVAWDIANEEPPAEYVVRLERGTVIGGRINDSEGGPVAGASVRMMLVGNPEVREQPAVTDHEVVTDAAGVWRCEIAPRELRCVKLRVRGAGDKVYQSFRYGEGAERSVESLRDFSDAIVLDARRLLSGVVASADGVPARDALVRAWRDEDGPAGARHARCNGEGRFELPSFKPGDVTLLVESEGLAPVLVHKTAAELSKPATVSLEPGVSLRGRVSDPRGEPVSGAMVWVGSWLGVDNVLSWRAETDGDGRFYWNHAPRDGLVLRAGKPGFKEGGVSLLHVKEEGCAIVLDVSLRFSGSVVDAETGAPLPRFLVVPGAEITQCGGGKSQMYWERPGAVEGRDGRYSISLGDSECARRIRIEAEGHMPAFSDAANPDAGDVAFDARLSRGGGPSGTLLSSDGQPIAGAEVYMCTASEGLWLIDGRVGSRFEGLSATTDAHGRFSLPHEPEPFTLVALRDDGYCEASSEASEGDLQMRMMPWARIEGKVYAGGEPARDCRVDLRMTRVAGNVASTRILFDYRTRADAEGRFKVERVVPGELSVDQRIAMGGGLILVRYGQEARVEPGAMLEMTIGGSGRAVVGSVVRPDYGVGARADLSRSSCSITATGSGAAMMQCHFELRRNGLFNVAGIPPGDYVLRVNVTQPSAPNRQYPEPLQAERAFTVVEGDPNVPVDLGVLRLAESVGPTEAEPRVRLKPDESVPPFEVDSIEGARLRLEDFRGKYLLLHFWASWCGACPAQTPYLKAVHQGFGRDGRFAMLGVSIDSELGQARMHAEKEGMDWPQAWAGTSPQGVARLLGVDGVPTVMLIDPDGRLVMNGLYGDGIGVAVRQVLRSQPEE